MANIMISILPDGMPVDSMEETEEGNTCPLPTQDAELNAENREIAVEEHNYREPNTGVASRSDQVCGNCSAYNQTEDTLECIGDDSGDLGYCQLLKFVCKSENVCDSWAEGGPITSDIQEEYKDYL
jgi:hypothetical protein